MTDAVRELQAEVRELRTAVVELRSEAGQYRAETEQLRKELQATRARSPKLPLRPLPVRRLRRWKSAFLPWKSHPSC